MKPTLVAMVGLPRSGKSTVVEGLRMRLGCPVVRRDAIRLAVHGQRYEPFIKALDLYMIRSLFLAGHDVVICDETNFSKAARNHMRDDSWDTVFYHVQTEPEVCMERAIRTNQTDLLGVIAAMAKRWENFEPSDEMFVDLTDTNTIVTRLYETV